MPLSASYRWMGEGRLDLAALRRALEAEGLTTIREDRAEGRVVLEGGSRLRARLLGSRWIRPGQIPIRVELRGAPAGDTGRFIVRLAIRDRFDAPVNDGALGERFEQAAGRIERIVGARLSAMGDYSRSSSASVAISPTLVSSAFASRSSVV